MLLETIQGKSVSCPSCLAGEVGKLDNLVLRRPRSVGGGGGVSPGPSPGFVRTVRTVPLLMSSSSQSVTEIVADSWKPFTQISVSSPFSSCIKSHKERANILKLLAVRLGVQSSLRDWGCRARCGTWGAELAVGPVCLFFTV